VSSPTSRLPGTADATLPKSRGLSYQQLLDTDTKPVPAVLRECSPRNLGSHDIPVERYTSRAFHELEVEKVWKRVWQMACREEEIPEVGDHVVYEIANLSILVMRSAPGEIRAYHNVCLHRGRILRERDGNCRKIRCPFHGFTWSLDGKLETIPADWDFPHVDKANFSLPECRVGTWGGFVFINMDTECEPLERYLAGLDAQFARWPLERRYKAAHVAKIIPTNWKVVQEAFSEAYHVIATHPQILAGIGDANSQYDVYENFSRAITPNATPSPHLDWQPTEQEMFDAMVDRRIDEDPMLVIPPGMTARQVAAEGSRMMLRDVCGKEYADGLCDSELVDSFYYTVFPNFHPWGAFNRIVYRFRPYRDEHEMSIMECMYLAPYKEGEKPPPAKIHWLGLDDPWTDAPELGGLARIFNQDVFNLPKVQRGLRATQKPGVTLANYQEAKIRHFHTLLEKWIHT
jgi:phenylpropionate dioxygenase-like ring-hydroxylating dioxygenase large terminal subunit